MLDPLRVGDTRKSVSIRLYRLGNGTVPELLKNVDQAFADHLLEMDGFEAAHLLDCGDNEVLWVSFLRDAGAIEQSDERLVRFFRDELASPYRPERVVTIRGDVAVSRANAALVEPAHA